jgi:hypothetical protein
MRRMIVLTAAVALLCSAATAQTWAEFVRQDLQFAINFPAPPAAADATYTTSAGTSVPARVFSAQQAGARYSMTVVDFSMRPWEENGAIAHAAAQLAKKGRVRYEAPVDLDGIPGHTLSATTPDGGFMMVSIYQFSHRLYIAEAWVPAGATPPSQFQQSVVIMHPDGSRVNLRPPRDPNVPQPFDPNRPIR